MSNNMQSPLSENSDPLVTANHCINQKKFNEASRIIDQEIEKTPSNDRAVMLKSALFEAKQDYKKALDECNEAINMAPQHALYKLKKGQLLFFLDDLNSVKDTLLDFLINSPDHKDGLNLLANVYQRLNEKVPELIILLRLSNVSTLSNERASRIFLLANQVNITHFSPESVGGIIKLLDREEFDGRSLSYLISRYIEFQYLSENTKTNVSLVRILNDNLLMKALPLVRLCSYKVEQFLTGLRKALSVVLINDEKNTLRFISIVRAIGLNNFLNEYVAYIDDTDTELLHNAVKLLEIAMQSECWHPEKSEALLLFIAMYQSLYELPCSSKMLDFDLESWPKSLHDIAKLSLFDTQNEINIANNIETLSEIKNSVSKQVQQQYEEHPYPRWTKTSASTIPNLAAAIVYSAPQVQERLPKTLFDPNTPMLVAGCGTGHQPIIQAKRFPGSRITAIDISRRSLAYAKIKANELNIRNVDFYQADILELPDTLGMFDYIECCGVLHHMEDPKKGWKKLVGRLNQSGIMKIALYSATARKAITDERETIENLGLSPTSESIRRHRQTMFQKATFQKGASNNAIISSDNFFSLSECRDLLFHRQEHCFSWRDIQQCCEELGLEFLGLTELDTVRDAFFKAYPQEKNTSSLTLLDEFERNNPDAFRAMYQFLVQKKTLS